MQPYEKFLKLGSTSLSDEELLAIIIRTGSQGNNSSQIALNVLNLLPEKKLSGLYHTSLKELMQISGIGEVKAVKIKCIAEFAARISQTSAEEKLQFTNPETIADYYMESLRHEEKERVILLMFNQRMQLLKESIVSIGTVSASIVSPREIFLEALAEKAVKIMMLHNHPSGDPSPSSHDLAITRRIEESGMMLNIPLVDHIIIGDRKYYSFREKNLLKNNAMG